MANLRLELGRYWGASGGNGGYPFALGLGRRDGYKLGSRLEEWREALSWGTLRVGAAALVSAPEALPPAARPQETSWLRAVRERRDSQWTRPHRSPQGSEVDVKEWKDLTVTVNRVYFCKTQKEM